ncbi:MAG: ABC transporter permease subunit [Acidobacteria bacterium]|nr:ABC transporter permease subunit [Acidobacteriota bacterium]
MFDRHRIATLMGKELREFRANPTSVLPVTLVVFICLVLPFMVLKIVPSATGQSIANDDMLRKAVAFASKHLDEFAALTADQAAEAFLFQQFLMLFLIAPLLGGVALAAHSVVGEKQGKTLEPLLTTPVGTSELLVAKVLAAFLPSLVIEGLGLILYLLGLWLFASPGVLQAVVSARSIVLLVAIGPLATLAALQATIAVSSRANDPRSAQQIAVLLVLPLMIMLIGQIVGAFVVTITTLILMAVAMAVAWGLLVMLSVALFDRENILTRWR